MTKRKSQVEVSPASQTEVSVARVSSFRRFLKNCGINLGAGSPSSTRSSTGLSSSITLVANTDTNKTLVVATTQAQSPNSKAHSRSIKYIFLSPFRSRKSPGTSSSAASSFPAATATGSEFLASGIHSAARIAVAHATHQPLPHPSRPTPTAQQSQPDPSPDPDELQLAIKELQEAHAKAQAERWPYTDRIAVVLRILNEYSLIVDVAISSNPTIAALVWSGIRLILSVALNHLNYLDHMELMMTTVVDKLAVCQFYERIYAGVALDATLEQESSKKNMRENLGKALGLFYVAIQEFVQEATSFFNVSLKTLFVPFAQKMQPLLDVIKERENELRKFADLATMQNVKDMTAKLENMQSTLEVIKKGMTWSDKLQDMESSLTKLLQEQHRAVKSTMEVKEIAKEILQKLDDGQMKNRPDVIKLSFSLGFEAPWPSRHNNDFVGRAYLLAQLDTQIKEGQGTPDCNHIVLYGTGGMGKTQLALEYVYRHHKEYTSVFWVNAASTQTLHRDFIDIMQRLIKHHALLTTEADFTRIGQLLGMSGKLDTAGAFILQAGEEKHVVNAVLEYLSHPGNNKWLLVVDNYDDIESVDIDDYTPTCHHGTVIITTRRAQCIQGRRGFEVEQMRGSEAETLLLKSAKRNWSQITDSTDLKNQKAAVKKLLEKLGYVPLAIDQAGAYIHVNKHTFARYLEDYEANVAYFLKRNSKMGKRERSVFAAWELSFEAIKSQNPNAAELLLVCGFLGNDDLCDELLRRGKKLPNSDMSLRESIQLLFSYSFANRKDKEDSFSIHPLVHEWARRRLESDTKAFTDKAIESFLLVTSAITQPPNVHRGVKDWIFERRVMHHIAAVEGHMKQGEPMIDKPEILTAACQLARIHMQHGRYELSLEWYKAALGANEKLLGPEHQDSLTTIHQIGLVYSAQDAYDDALKWFTRALEGREKVLGLENVETLQTVHEMAAVFNRKGQYNKAVEWFTRALTGRSKELGEDHLETLMTVNNLALVQQNLGHYSEALEGYKRALAGREKALGSDHPETLTTVNNMASIFSKLGQHDVALEWYQRALSGKEKSMGKDHPSVLTTVHNIGILFAIKAKYDIALEWYQRALTGMAKSLGAENPLTLNTTHDIGSLYQDKAQYEKAIEWYRRALAGREKSLGSSHPHTLSTVNNMAAVFSEQRKFDLALQWYNRALEGNEKRLGADHLDTLATVHNIATVLRNQGKYDEALTYYQRALAGYEKSMGPEDSSTLTIVSSIATIFNLQQHHDKALEWYTRAVQGLEKSLGAKHPQTLAIVTNIATVYDQQQDYDTALQWYNRSLAGLEEEPGVEHPTTLTTMYNIASIFDKTGQCEKAMDMYKRTLAGQEKIFGITHPDTLDTMHDIAVVYEDMNELDDSVEWFERVLDARSDAFGDANESTQETLQGLIQVLGKLGQTARVGELQKRLVQQSPPEA